MTMLLPSHSSHPNFNHYGETGLVSGRGRENTNREKQTYQGHVRSLESTRAVMCTRVVPHQDTGFNISPTTVRCEQRKGRFCIYPCLRNGCVVLMSEQSTDTVGVHMGRRERTQVSSARWDKSARVGVARSSLVHNPTASPLSAGTLDQNDKIIEVDLQKLNNDDSVSDMKESGRSTTGFDSLFRFRG